ncbi:AcrR family transcriptional regulator [Crossiella equi]|uniref:AcrR family transcriptional regulator n=1 Tax=Crossiella equi TaxID=130796 RepID=A0ABS5ANR7_9PSEU|nr:TetR/AcrR family transcriptional regulator [Crossiella equi]MBP2478230.1 AcrR family transcriptional regulator [Crossiella equi]
MAGRPRDPELEQRLLAAAWALLASNGYDGLTLSQVATRAGAHRTDVYRRWATKAHLVAEALAVHVPPVPELDTGALYTDLRAFLQALEAAWSASWVHGLVGLIADLARDGEAEAAFLGMARARGQRLVEAVRRAADRGEVAEMPDSAVLVLLGDLLEGPLMHRRLFERQGFGDGELDALARVGYRQLTGREAPCTN